LRSNTAHVKTFPQNRLRTFKDLTLLGLYKVPSVVKFVDIATQQIQVEN